MFKTKTGILTTTLAVLAIVTLGARNSSAQSTPITDTQKTNYVPNANQPFTNQVNVTDPFEGLGYQAEVICAGFYVFDESENLQECCGCPISEDGLLTLEVDSAGGTTSGDLVSNPFNVRTGPTTLPFANIKILTFQLNPPSQLGGQDPVVCDATGTTYPYGQYPFPILQTINRTLRGDATLSLTPSIRAWATHLQNQTNLTESEFRDAPLTQTDANNYAEWCGDIQQAGSGRGVCSCGTNSAL